VQAGLSAHVHSRCSSPLKGGGSSLPGPLILLMLVSGLHIELDELDAR
jgi:hypothetical protein